MSRPYKGRRIKMTIRLPYDVFEEAALRAAARRWDMSTYVGWCVERALNPHAVAAKQRADPTLQPTAAAAGSRKRRAAYLGPRGAGTPPDA